MSEHNVSVEGGTSVRLLTSGKYCDRDIVVTAINDGMAESLIAGTARHIDIPSGITTIRNYAFTGFDTLFSVKIPESVTSIGLSAFRDCSVLQTLTLPNGLESISASAFTGCKCLLSFIIPDSVTTIASSGFGDGVFAQCTALRTITIGRNVTTLSGPTFLGCKSLRTAIFRGKTDITSSTGAYPFYQLTGVTDIYVPWAEGEVPNAPWGAANATIHYNTKVED